MGLGQTERGREWLRRVQDFMDAHVYPSEETFHDQQRAMGADRFRTPAIVTELKAKAKAAGLWNMFMPPHSGAPRLDGTFTFECPHLTNLEYAPIAELLGRVEWASEVFNCSAPDTGNMEVLERYGTREQKEQWLRPLMDGAIRSAFLMTEPGVASSDATNIETRIERDGDSYVINGRKWWSTGVANSVCRVYIVMGKTDPAARKHVQQSMIVVPANTKGLRIVRNLSVFGYDDAPRGHGEVVLDNVRVPADCLVAGEGRGFEIAQGRLGPGRIHHTMRVIGTAEAALEKMCKRLLSRRAFGKTIAEHSVWEERIARARIDIDMARLLCLSAAHTMDVAGNKAARAEIAMIKVAAPRMALRIIDDAIQAHGGGGVSEDFGLARAYARIRPLRLADGPDEVHNRAIARLELAKYAEPK